MVVESRSVIRNAKNARGLGRDIFPAATAPFPKSCASYFRFARFNTFPLYYLRAWHRLKNTGSSGTSEKCPVFPVGMFQTEVVFHFIKAICDTSFRPSRTLIGKWIWFVQMVNPIPGLNLLVLNSAYHLPKLWTDRFAHVNGKQPLSPLKLKGLNPGVIS